MGIGGLWANIRIVVPARPRHQPRGGLSSLLPSWGRFIFDIRTSIRTGRCTMRNRDSVSDWFLGLIAAGLLLLFSILLAVALI
jgi:hypothetical protein